MADHRRIVPCLDVDVVRRTAKGITVPLAVGGGISSIEGINELLEAGASKVSILGHNRS